MSRITLLVVLVLSSAVTACENRTAEAASTTASAAVVASGASTIEVAAKDATSKVARVVFIGKEHACDCTRKRVEGGWAALQKALGTPAKLPVETLQIDTQEDKAEPYKKMRPIMALPAIYFVDAKGNLVEMLQGEITEAQVTGVLTK